jgi:hypothetical protein
MNTPEEKEFLDSITITPERAKDLDVWIDAVEDTKYYTKKEKQKLQAQSDQDTERRAIEIRSMLSEIGKKNTKPRKTKELLERVAFLEKHEPRNEIERAYVRDKVSERRESEIEPLAEKGRKWGTQGGEHIDRMNEERKAQAAKDYKRILKIWEQLESERLAGTMNTNECYDYIKDLLKDEHGQSISTSKIDRALGKKK